MLCEKCHKNEATVHITHVTSTCTPGGDASKQVSTTQNLCPDCAEAQDAADPQRNLDAMWKPTNIPEAFPAFFTHAFQNAILDRVEAQSPGIFDLRREEEEFDIEKFKIRHTAVRERLGAEVVFELEKHNALSERNLSLMMVAALQSALLPRMVRKKIARKYPTLTPAEVEANLFFWECCQMVIKGPRVKRYANISGREMLSIAPTVAQKLYGESARSELKQIGVVSSKALGGLILRLMEKGVLDKSDVDRIEDFQTRSPLDDFLAQNDGA